MKKNNERERHVYPPHFLESSTHQDHGPNKIAWNKVIQGRLPLPTLPP